ncbi:putative transcriptional regulatory protein [Triangularia verruculosa]|uniref:Transcriptional regulatory protein n=1 Tax=Triangularia verruculosa TaxID=2587418 RepID=A0AAN6X9E9_9PEZI|nr:putative transcriptional regulatory protein [Triangularia verruculosa]
MVYGGKPSRGCRTCRQRRIKCDEGKPTCKRCEKSRRECGGYRPEFEIVHRDQTKSTVHRLRGSQTASTSPLPSSAAETNSRALVFVQEEPQSWGRESSSPSPVITVPLAQRASCYFASNFILVPMTEKTPHGYMEYLIPLIESEPADSSLRYAFNACAFALLNHNNRSDSVDLAQLSLKQHTLALGKTYKALSHPAKATAHATLATVLLLSLYESITANKESRMLAWRSHIDGAVNIIKLRGRDDICRTKTGALLFAAVRHQLVSRTLSSGMPIPFGTDWWMLPGAENNTILATSQHLALKYTDLRTEFDRVLVGQAKTPQTIEQIHRLLQKVQALDREIVSWQASVPEQFCFQTLCWVCEDDTDLTRHGDYGQVEVFPGRIDVYPDFVTASAWNISRVCRLLLAALSIRLTAYNCSPIDYRTTPGFQASSKICKETIPEILASVPYHFGWHMKRRNEVNTKSDISGFACGDEGALKALPALLLIWPLTCVKNHDITTEEQRVWAKGRLRVITDNVGLKYARIVNDVELRFPSMFIGHNGLPASPQLFSGPGLPLRPVDIPPTPESMTSAKSPSPK